MLAMKARQVSLTDPAPGRTQPATPRSNRIREKISNPDTDYACDWTLFPWERPPHSDNEARKRVLEWLRGEFPDFPEEELRKEVGPRLLKWRGSWEGR